MKFKRTLSSLCFALVSVLQLSAQNVYVNSLDVTENKTTSIVFPQAIKSVDIGSRNVLAQKVPGAENVLQIKADTSVFNETNLTVIIEGGTLHQFDIRYAQRPSSCYFLIDKFGIMESVQSVILNENNPVLLFEKVYSALGGPAAKIEKEKEGKVSMILHPIHIRSGHLFFNLTYRNNSNLRYDIESVRFLVKDKKRAKRSAVQEVQVIPIHLSRDVKSIPEKGSANVIYTFDKFTISDSKELIIEVTERNGARHFNMRVHRNDINNSLPVNVK
jgi:conjugative transposon TraN protein